MVKLWTQNEEFATTKLTGQEKQILDTQWQELFMPAWSFERKYINSKYDHVVTAVEAAKNALDELTFGGFNCGNSEIGISVIRPGQVGLVNGAVPEANNVWKWKHNTVRAAQGVGWENWIHSPTTATTAFSVHEDSFIYPMYVVEENCSPLIQGIKFDIGRTNILYYEVTPCRLRDYQTGLNLIPLPTQYWLPNMDVLVALDFKMAGVTEPRLGGFAIGKGSFLNSTHYAASTNTVSTEATAQF